MYDVNDLDIVKPVEIYSNIADLWQRYEVAVLCKVCQGITVDCDKCISNRLI